ncbi:Glyoxalase/fosfomycin resistance/dioxygenase domain [Dillenia turbinata]|uniref:Glyoxalase/fosfomycin resistance/dioxygenase domain n=1 Tax=Dillenia turbinata TaxID=194707 RepID=A0AAN8VM87_9MAGN
MGLAQGVTLAHIARETTNVKRLAQFYIEVLGFEEIEAPDFGDFEVIWLRLPSCPMLSLHLIQRNPESRLPEGPWSSSSSVKDPRFLPRGHHISFGVSNFDSFVQSLKEKGIEMFEKTQPDGKTKQVFFFDPDGNGLEAGTW